jgi:oligopeptide transport system substrate-binding protein
MPAFLSRCLTALACGTALLFSGGCSDDQISAREGAARKIFLINNRSEPRFLDLQRANSTAEHQINLALFEGLVAESKNSDRDVEPGVAERWEPNADKSVWTFHIRKNAMWSDGVPITAHDVVWSWRRMLMKELGSEYSKMLFLLKNGEAYYQKKVPAEELGVRAVDDYTLEVTLVGPTPHYPSIACHTSWWMVPRHAIEKWGGITDVMNPWFEPGKMVSNGPFTLKRYTFRRYLETERNPRYWDAATVKLDGVRFYAIESDNTEERIFRRGQLHATYNVPLAKIPDYMRDHPDVISNQLNLAIRLYRVNIARGPLKDVRVRRALGFSLDRQSMIDNILRANEKPALGIVPPMEGYEGVKEFRFDPAEAKRLMAEAGFPDGKGFPTNLNILISKSEVAVQIAEAVQAMWKEHLGISVGIASQDYTVYLTSQQQKDYDIAFGGWNADYYDPATFVDMWVTEGGNNHTNWSSAEFDKLVFDATQCADAEKRLKILHDAEAVALKDAAVLPIYYITRTRLIHPAVKEWQPRALDNRLWKYMDLISPPPPCSMDDELKRD